MCTGLEIAAVAALAGGAGLQAKSAIDSSNAQRRIGTDLAQQQTELLRRQQEDNRQAQLRIDEEKAKQAEIRKKVAETTDKAIDRNTRESTDKLLEDLTQKRTEGFKTIADLVPVAIDLGGKSSAPSIVQDAIDKSIEKSTAKSDQQATALSKILGLGDVNLSLGIDRARDVEDIGTQARLNNISNVLSNAEQNFVNNLAQITSAQIGNAATGANQRLGVKLAKAQNAKAIGDLLFAAGSFGMGAAGGGGAGAGAANRGAGGVPIPVPKPT